MGKVLLENSHPDAIQFGIAPELQNMTLEKVFWSRFTPNLVPATWIVGVLIGGVGLDLLTGTLAIIVGNLLGSIPVALLGNMGPVTGLPQIEASRFAFGRSGMRLTALGNWITCIGWDAVNNIPSTLALIAFCALWGYIAPFWLGLGLLVVLQTIIGASGHHLVQIATKYVGYVLLISFAAIAILSIKYGVGLPAHSTSVSAASFISCVAIATSYNLGWAPYASDYTRYLPKRTSKPAVFCVSVSALMISAVLLEILGLVTSQAINGATPDALIHGIPGLTGAFAPLALVALAISSIPQNAMNDNTGAYSLISAGVRIPRTVSAIIASVVGFLLALLGAGKFVALYQNYLLVLLYWIAPWCGIVIAHWWLANPKARENVPTGWTSGAWIFVTVSGLTMLLFASTPNYTGPVARSIGGLDVGYFVGFISAAVSYVILNRRALLPWRRFKIKTGSGLGRS